MKKLLLILLFPLALGAQNFKHESGGINGVSDYSDGTIETDTLRTRYIRLLDGLNSDSIASYIYFDGDTSRWAGDPIKIGNNSIIIKDDTVKISNAMLTVSGQVQADTLVPYHNSTIYVRHFTVDTIEIVKYIHQQEVAQFDSVAEWVGDGDTLRIDASINANVLEYEDENVTKAALDSAGNWTAQNLIAEKRLAVTDSARNEGPLRQKGASTFGATATPAVITSAGDIGIGTAAPIFDLSIVNSNPPTNNGIHVVDSNVNKNRTTYAQATDSASAMLSTIGGNGWLRLRGVKGAVDTISIYAAGVTARIDTRNILDIVAGGITYRFNTNAGSGFSPITDGTVGLGILNYRWKSLAVADNGYFGGKGKTAKLIIGTQNTMTEETDSCTVITPTAGSGSIALASSVGSIVNFVGIQPATYTSAINQMWVNVTRDTLFIRGATGNAFYSKLTDLGATH